MKRKKKLKLESTFAVFVPLTSTSLPTHCSCPPSTRFTLKRTTTNQFINSPIGCSLIEQDRLRELFGNDYRIQEKDRGPNRKVLYSFRVIRVAYPVHAMDCQGILFYVKMIALESRK